MNDGERFMVLIGATLESREHPNTWSALTTAVVDEMAQSNPQTIEEVRECLDRAVGRFK